MPPAEPPLLPGDPHPRRPLRTRQLPRPHIAIAPEILSSGQAERCSLAAPPGPPMKVALSLKARSRRPRPARSAAGQGRQPRGRLGRSGARDRAPPRPWRRPKPGPATSADAVPLAHHRCLLDPPKYLRPCHLRALYRGSGISRSSRPRTPSVVTFRDRPHPPATSRTTSPSR
jgi:hypothetical protein